MGAGTAGQALRERALALGFDAVEVAQRAEARGVGGLRVAAGHLQAAHGRERGLGPRRPDE